MGFQHNAAGSAPLAAKDIAAAPVIFICIGIGRKIPGEQPGSHLLKSRNERLVAVFHQKIPNHLERPPVQQSGCLFGPKPAAGSLRFPLPPNPPKHHFPPALLTIISQNVCMKKCFFESIME